MSRACNFIFVLHTGLKDERTAVGQARGWQDVKRAGAAGRTHRRIVRRGGLLPFSLTFGSSSRCRQGCRRRRRDQAASEGWMAAGR